MNLNLYIYTSSVIFDCTYFIFLWHRRINLFCFCTHTRSGGFIKFFHCSCSLVSVQANHELSSTTLEDSWQKVRAIERERERELYKMKIPSEKRNSNEFSTKFNSKILHTRAECEQSVLLTKQTSLFVCVCIEFWDQQQPVWVFMLGLMFVYHPPLYFFFTLRLSPSLLHHSVYQTMSLLHDNSQFGSGGFCHSSRFFLCIGQLLFLLLSLLFYFHLCPLWSNRI